MKIYTKNNWQYWFDRSPGQNVWYAAKFDAEGNQISDAFHAHSKNEIQYLIEMEINHDLL
jgi:hypothetical protein